MLNYNFYNTEFLHDLVGENKQMFSVKWEISAGPEHIHKPVY